MEASFIEIYNETLHDLLAAGKRDLKHEIRIDPKNEGEVYVTNITPVLITSEQQVCLFVVNNSLYQCQIVYMSQLICLFRFPVF